MPYFVHYRACEPADGSEFATKQEAIDARSGDRIISFVASPEERDKWRIRERERFYSDTYNAVPWASRVVSAVNGYYTSDTDKIAYQRLLEHFPHYSTKQPGKIAYTPDETFGHEDRQLTVTPARYLEQFHKDGGLQLSRAEIAEYVAEVAASADGFKLAETPDDCVAIYTAKSSPSSCMDSSHHFRDGHPAAVYGGDADLTVAYMGIIGPDTDESKISARAVVWPAKKSYYSIYGAVSALRIALESAGYEECSSFDGARIRAVKNSRGQYLMPYVDGADYAYLDGKFFTLTGESGDGDGCTYYAKVTNGITSLSEDSEEETHTCSHCGDEHDRGEEYNLCDSCEEDSFYCERCEETCFGMDDSRSTEYATLCEHCYSQTRHSCEVCEDDYSEYDYGWQERRRLDRADDWSLCPDCRESGAYRCSACDSACDADTVSRTENLCRDCAHTRNRIPARPRGNTLRHHTINPPGDVARYIPPSLLEQPFLPLDVPSEMPVIREMPTVTIGEAYRAGMLPHVQALAASGIGFVWPDWLETAPSLPIVAEYETFGTYGADNERSLALDAAYPRAELSADQCGRYSQRQRWVCTRPRGHSGPHVGHWSRTDAPVCAAWPNTASVADDTMPTYQPHVATTPDMPIPVW